MRSPPSDPNVTVSGSATRAPPASAAISSRAVPSQPAQVEKGTTTLPRQSPACSSVRTAGAMVYHQVGVPTAITS